MEEKAGAIIEKKLDTSDFSHFEFAFSSMFTIFFPSDLTPLTVSGPDNRTYWLMLLVRSDAIHNFKIIYYLAVAIEVCCFGSQVSHGYLFQVIALLMGYIFHIRGFVLFCKTRVSENLSVQF